MIWRLRMLAAIPSSPGAKQWLLFAELTVVSTKALGTGGLPRLPLKDLTIRGRSSVGPIRAPRFASLPNWVNDYNLQTFNTSLNCLATETGSANIDHLGICSGPSTWNNYKMLTSSSVSCIEYN
jgi:hypothetical protein